MQKYCFNSYNIIPNNIDYLLAADMLLISKIAVRFLFCIAHVVPADFMMDWDLIDLLDRKSRESCSVQEVEQGTINNQEKQDIPHHYSWEFLSAPRMSDSKCVKS